MAAVVVAAVVVAAVVNGAAVVTIVPLDLKPDMPVKFINEIIKNLLK